MHNQGSVSANNKHRINIKLFMQTTVWKITKE